MTSLTTRLHTAFPHGTFRRHVLVLAGGTAIAQTLGVLTAPFLSRIYAPSDFGVFSVYVSILSVLLSIASLRYEFAIPLCETDEDALQVLALALLLVPIMTVLSVAALWVFRVALLEWTGTTAMGWYFWSLPVGMAAAGFYQVVSYWAVRRKAFSEIARTKVSQAASQIVAQLGLGLVHLTPGGLLVGDVVGRASGTLTLGSLAFRGQAYQFSAQRMRAMAGRYVRFPLFASAASLLNTLGSWLPPLLLAGLFGPNTAGWFHIGQRLIGIPLALVGTSIAQVYVGEAARIARENPRALRYLFLRTARRLFVVTVGPVALLALIGPITFAAVLGEPWREAGDYVRVLSLKYLLEFVLAPLSMTLNVLERQQWQVGWDAGRVALTVITLGIAHLTGRHALWAIGLYGVAMALAYVVLFVLSLAGIERHIREFERVSLDNRPLEQ